jgi:phage terminase large subunit GpA-like protein
MTSAAFAESPRRLASPRDLVREVREIIRPPPPRAPDEWADACRVLPPTAAEPGPFRTARTPYTIEPQRAMTEPTVEGVVVILPSQAGKTDATLSIIGHRADDDPTPILYVGPTRDFVENEFSPRAVTLLQSTPALWAKVAHGKKQKKTRLLISGTELRMAWAGSPKQLVGFSCGLAIFDERDQADADLRSQGDPLEMVRARGRTYPGFRWIVTSTITNGSVETFVHPETGLEHWKPVEDKDDLQSPTWKLWQDGTRHEWAWPCLECGEYFVPRFKLLRWPDGAEPDEAAVLAWVECPRCEARLTDRDRPRMLERGRYVSPGQHVERDGTVVGEGVRSSVRTYWCSGLAAAWASFGGLARDWLAAVRSGEPGRVQGVLNLGFAELYSIRAEAPDWRRVLELRGGYEQGVVPPGVLALVSFVDVQKDRLVWEVRGFGYRMEAWLIAFGEIHGATDLDQVWSDLERDVLRKPWGAEQEMLRAMLVDSGYRPGDKFKRPDNKIYEFARRFPNVVRATKGHEAGDKPFWASTIDVSVNGRVIPGGLQLWHLDTDFFKSFVVAKLSPPEGQPSTWHLPIDVTDDYCQQVTAEVRVTRASGKAKWIRVRKANHFFDTAAGTVAAAYMLNMHLLVEPPTTTEGGPPVGPRPAQPARVARSNWMAR